MNSRIPVSAPVPITSLSIVKRFAKQPIPLCAALYYMIANFISGGEASWPRRHREAASAAVAIQEQPLGMDCFRQRCARCRNDASSLGFKYGGGDAAHAQ